MCWLQMVAPVGSVEDPVTAITTKFVKTVYNKQRCPIFCTKVRVILSQMFFCCYHVWWTHSCLYPSVNFETQGIFLSFTLAISCFCRESNSGGK